MKAFIENVVNGRKFGASFDTEFELQSWIDKQVAKESWGKNEYFELKDEKSHQNPRAEFVEEVAQSEPAFDENYEPILDENGDQTFVDIVKYKYRIPCEYVITVDETPTDLAPGFWAELRKARDAKLLETDWSQLADAPLSTEQRGHYREYRKYLRDLPLQYNDSSIHEWNIKSFEEWKDWKYPR